MKKITPKQERAIAAYLETGDMTAAYRAAYDCSRMGPRTVNDLGYKLFKRPLVKARVAELQERITQTLVADRQKVLQALIDIALADATELAGVQVRGCRHCWGQNFEYQWHSPAEYAVKCAAVIDQNNVEERRWARSCAEENLRPDPTPIPSDRGGYGFQVERGPNPECPHCLGQGHEVVKITDTRKLKGAARRLYAGVKQTKDGIEIKTRDQDRALDILQKHFKITEPEIANNITVENKTLNVTATVIPNDPAEASNIYRQLIQGS